MKFLFSLVSIFFVSLLTLFFRVGHAYSDPLLWKATDGINQVEPYEMGYETAVKLHDGDDETPNL